MYHNRKVLSFIAAILYIIVLCSSGIIVAGQNDNPSATLPPRPVLDENHPVNTMDVRPDTWVATDGLGRTLSGYNEVGPKREDRFVGLFYWTWHGSHAKSTVPRNVQQLLDSLTPEEAEKAKNDYKHPVWERRTGYHFWNEPIFGYYSTNDKYVLRKHAEMLADAGVDVVIFDNTNGSFLWQDSYTALMETWSEARQQGVNTPQVTFMLNFGPLETTAEMLVNIYKDIYQQEKFKDLWFYWDGKPFIMAHEKALDARNPLQAEILEFFTFRNNDPSYFTKTENAKPNSWGWLSTYPQCKYNVDKNGNVEQMTVGVAQNATTTKLTAMNGKNVLGRSYGHDGYSYSYTYRGKEIVVNSDIPDSKLYGINLQQQFDYAIENDPKFIFVTGWNEWVAIRFDEWSGVPNGMADQFNDEYSRDLEPSKGDLKDHYYYQLVENIRRYKGVSEPEEIDVYKKIDIFGDLSQWDDIASFNHYIKNTWERNDRGYLTKTYKNDTMRNDIRRAKVAFDENNIYFYVETVDNLTPYTDPAWMRLFIDTMPATEDSKDWEEIEFVVNRQNPTDSIAYLERSKGGWDWEVVQEVRYSVMDNVLQIEIPRKALGLDDTDAPLFNFKWADNMQEDGDILDFYVNGDVAPGGRFMFHFNTKPVKNADIADKETKKGGIQPVVIVSIISASAVVAVVVAAVLIVKKSNASKVSS